MSEKLTALADQIGELSVLELADFIKMLEEKFGVEAAAPMAMGGMMMAPGAAAGGGEAEAEPTSFNVILKEAGSQKIPVIKEVRAITGLGLKEAKEVVDGAPKALKEGVDKAEAEKIKETLEGIGATIELQPA